MNTGSSNITIIIQEDDTTDIHNKLYTEKDLNVIAGWVKRTLSGVHEFDVDFFSSGAQSVEISEVRLMLWRQS